MPEGDVVWNTARRLHEALAGRTLTRSDFRVPRLATANLAGNVVTETASRGKHLLTRTENGLTVHTHLRMDGSWRIRPAEASIKLNTMFPEKLDLPTVEPLCHFAEPQDVVIWPLESSDR